MNIILVSTLILIAIVSYFNQYLYFLSIPIIHYIYYQVNKVVGVLSVIFVLITYINIWNFKNDEFDYFFLMGYIGSLIMTVILHSLIIKRKERTIDTLHQELIHSEGNIILKNILKLAVEDERMTIIESTEKVCKAIREYYNVDYCTIFLNNSRGISIASTNIEKKYIKHMEKFANEKLTEMIDDNNDAAAYIICGDEALAYPTAMHRGVCYFYFIPLKMGDKFLGALMIEDKTRHKMESLEDDFFQIIIENISIVLQNFIYKGKLVSAVMVDGLTQVWNRTYLNKYLENEMKKHEVQNERLSLAILDIDHFKQFNDNYGHLHGDKVLKRVSGFIKDNIRGGKDIIARYGGEEFVIVFPFTDNENVLNKLDEIREEISQLYITNENSKNTPVTVSFGIAEYPTDSASIEGLIKKADEALDYSKENGRNKVTQYRKIEKRLTK